MSRKSILTRNTWLEHIEQWQNSGQTQADYCRRHGLKPHQFCYWRGKLSPSHEPACDSVPPAHSAPDFIPVVIEATDSSSLTLCLPNGIRVEGVTSQTVGLTQRLIEVLK